MRLALAPLVLILALLAGCGGDGEEGGPTTGQSKVQKPPETQRSETTTEAPATQGERSGADAPHQQDTQGADGAGEPSEPARGGEASIEDFGAEAEGSERDAILAVFKGYLRSVAEPDYETSCAHLASTVRRSLSRFAGGRLKDGSCPALLAKLFAPTAAVLARQQAEGEITRVRAEGDRAFVVFKAPGAELYQLAMVRESGEWKAATIAGSVLVPSL